MSAVLQQSGVRIDRKAWDYIPATENIRPLRDRMLVEPIDWEPGGLKVFTTGGQPTCGKVLAIGPGVYPTKYSKDRSKSWSSKAFRKCDVEVGDIVQLEEYPYPQVQWGDRIVLVPREEDVTGVLDHGAGVPRCHTRNCTKFVESSENYCTDCLDDMHPVIRHA